MKEFIIHPVNEETEKEFIDHGAPELVRCKNCKKQNEIECPLHRVLEDGTVYSTVKSDFYCGYGKPKEGDQQ